MELRLHARLLGRVQRLVGVGAAAFVAAGCWAAPANAAPGVPQAPTTIFAEDFEHGMANAAVGLASYTGAPPVDMTYTAHPTWLNAAICNGIIVSRNSPAANGTLGCPVSIYNFWALGLAEGMGAYHGTGNNDHVLVDTTVAPSNSAPTPAPTLQTTKPIPLSAGDRFVSFAVDVAVACNGTPPRLRFFLLDGADEIPAFGGGGPINPCVAPLGQPYPVSTGLGSVRVRTYAANKGILFSGSTAGLKLTNDTGTGSGNDYAVDNIRMVDATPSLDKAFSPTEVTTQETSTLTFTVTNTSELGEKAGWSFTDDLPNGLTVAGPGSSDCPNATVGATTGSGQISATGDLAAGQTSCTISVPVKGAAGGIYQNGPDQLSTVGLNEPSSAATLTVKDVVKSTFCKAVSVIVLNQEVLPANAPATPCVEDDSALVNIYRVGLGSFGSLGVLTGSVLESHAGFGVADAPPSHGPSAATKLDRSDITLGATKIALRGIESAVSVRDSAFAIPGYDCRNPGVGRSRIAYLAINGTQIPVGDQPLTIPLGIGALHVNHTTAGPGSVIQRAVWLDLPDSADVVLGEARAGCSYA